MSDSPSDTKLVVPKNPYLAIPTRWYLTSAAVSTAVVVAISYFTQYRIEDEVRGAVLAFAASAMTFISILLTGVTRQLSHDPADRRRHFAHTLATVTTLVPTLWVVAQLRDSAFLFVLAAGIGVMTLLATFFQDMDESIDSKILFFVGIGQVLLITTQLR